MSARPKITKRRIPHQRNKEDMNLVRLRSDLLCREDKALIQMIFEKGSSFIEIAELTGQNPSSINRRFRALLQKLLAKEPISLLHHQNAFDPLDISICRDYYLQGLPQRTISHKLNVSLYRVRRVLRTVRYLLYNGTAPAVKRNRKSISKLEGVNDAHI